MRRPWTFQISIDKDDNSQLLYRLIAQHIQQQISQRVLKAGDLLPGTREMAEQWQVNRKTVVKAMQVLAEEGWIENRKRVGYFVLLQEQPIAEQLTNPMPEPVVSIQRVHINGGTPDTAQLPFTEFSRTYRQYFNRSARMNQLGYTGPLGYEAFRKVLADMLNHARGMNITSENICVTRGSQMALFLLAHVLLKAGDSIVLEYPGYERAYKTFQAAGIQTIPVPVDEHGICVNQLEQVLQQNSSVKAVYLTPRYQYPTTVTLSTYRRKTIAQMVQKYDVWVIEDDFGSDYRFGSRYFMPLCCQLPSNRFVYVGTFSKMFAPGIRVGYIASCIGFVKQIGEFRNLIDIQGDAICERTLLDLLVNGDIKRYLRKSSQVYTGKLNYFSQLIEQQLAGLVTYQKPGGGLAVWLELTAFSGSQEQLQQALQQAGVECRIHPTPSGNWGLRIGYATLTSDEMRFVVVGLAKILRR